MSFKDKWNEVDETCPNCNQVTKVSKGITKQNIKKLLTPKFGWNEILIMFLLLMVILMAYSYQSETKVSREWVNSMAIANYTECKLVCDSRCQSKIRKEVATEQVDYLKGIDLESVKS